MSPADILLRLRLLGQQATAAGLTGTTSKVERLRRVAAAGAVGIAGIGIAALDAAGDYEKSLNVFQATSSATGAQMKQAGDLAKQLGADIHLPGTSAADAASAMTELAQGGISVVDTFGAARSVLQLSAAAQIDNASAADITAKALNTFSLQGREATRVANLLAAAATSGAKVSELALGLQQAGASAAQLGIPLDDVVTSLTLLARKGVTGSDAGTSVKTMLMRLVPQTQQAADEMKRLGIDVFDSQGQFIGMRGAIKAYGGALRDKTQEEQAAALTTLFGADAQRAANILLLSGADAFDTMHTKVTRHGAAQDLATAQTKGFKGSLEAFRSTAETLAITWGEKLLPVATDFMQFLSANLEPAINDTVDTVKDVVHWFDEHETITTILISTLAGLTAGFVAYKAAAVAAGIVTGIVEGTATAFWALNAALDANPVGVVLLALVALGAALYVAYQRSETFRNIVDGLGHALKTGFLWAVEAIIDALDFLAGGLSTVLSALGSAGVGWAGDAARSIDAARESARKFGNEIDDVNTKAAAKFGGVTGKVHGVRTRTDTGNILSGVKGLATGGRVIRRGAVRVGEEGPEILDLPAGSVVHNAQSSAGMDAGQAEIIALLRRLVDRPIIVQMDGRNVAYANAMQLAREAAYR
jgi:TP901 family phage tail tape measure protein